MTNDTLNAELPYYTGKTNVPDRPTELAEWEVPEGSAIRITEGSPLIADFQTTAANTGPSGASADPSKKSRLALAYREPNTPLGQAVPFAEIPVAPFNVLSQKEQQSRENAENRIVRFLDDAAPEGVIEFSDSDHIVLLANSPDELDGDAIVVEYPMTTVDR
jgi:hypothetical protein